MPNITHNFKTAVIFTAFATVFLFACNTTKKPPPDYLTEVDRIAMEFGEQSERLTGIGDSFIALEDQRIKFDPKIKGLSDNRLIDKMEDLLDEMNSVRRKIIRLARDYKGLKKIPQSQDKDGRKVYKEHNDIMKRLFVALLGMDEDDKIRTAESLIDVMVEVKTPGGELETRSEEELKSKNIVLLFKDKLLDRSGYFTTLEDYIRLNILKLKGRVKVVVCTIDGRPSKGKYRCTVKKRDLVKVLGPLGQTEAKGGEPPTLRSILYHRKEKEVVSRIKQLIKARKRIADFLTKEAS